MSNSFIPVTCNHCEKPFRVKPAAVGRKVKCPACSQRVLVPESEGAVSEGNGSGGDGSGGTPPPLYAGAVPSKETADQGDFFRDLSAIEIGGESDSMAWDSEQPEPSPYQPPPSPPPALKTAQLAIRETGFTPRRYPALQIVQLILRVLAGVLVALSIGLMVLILVGFLLAIFQDDTRTSGVLSGFGFGLAWAFVCSLPMLLGALILFSYAELIKVFLDVQENTQRTAHFLRSRMS